MDLLWLLQARSRGAPSGLLLFASVSDFANPTYAQTRSGFRKELYTFTAIVKTRFSLNI